LCILHDFVTSPVTVAWQAADMVPAGVSLLCILHDFVTSPVTVAWQAADARRPTRHLSCVLHDFVTKCDYFVAGCGRPPSTVTIVLYFT
jgi:hypothetical protein